MKAGDGMGDSKRSALIVASDDYADPGLRRLRAPASDAQALAAVLRDPGIGGFEVRTLLNEPAHEISLAVEEFFADRRPDDLLVVHFSCHGVKDEDGELYFAASNTLLGRLGATAVAAEFVNRRMSRSRSRRVVLLLDCCYAGAFERGMTARAGAEIGIESQFGGRGRAVITASSSMEYAFEGDQLADTRELAPSVFTSALVQGLETGEADRDQDGQVALDELYDYIYDKVRTATPNQTPGKWTFGIQGELVIARRARPVTTPAPLPRELQEAIDSPFAAVRAAAVQELTRLLAGRHAGLALAARQALERLTDDDSRTAAAAATTALTAQPQEPERGPPEPAPPRLELTPKVVDFGRLARHATSPERRIWLGNAGGGTLNARAATQASWLRLRQEGDELVLAVDTTAEGEHEGTVTVDSDGGSAAIHARARVEPAPAGAHGAAAAITRTEAGPSGPEAARPGKQSAHPQAVPAPATEAPAPAAPAGPDAGTHRRSMSTGTSEQASAASAPAARSSGPATAGLQEAHENREQAGSGPPPGTLPAVPVPPGAGPPPAQGKPTGKQRRRVPARAAILVGAGVGVAAIVVLIAVMLGGSHATPPQAGAASTAPSPTVIFTDDFSTKSNGWADTFRPHQADGYYLNGTYRLKAPAGDYGQDAQPTKAPHNLGRTTPLNLSISVDARRITGSPQDTGYGITCRAAGNGNSYDFVITDSRAAIEKWVNDGANNQGPPDVSTFIVRADGTNRLRATCVTSNGGQAVHLAFWVNGTKVADWTDRNHPYTQGYLGVITGASTKMTSEAEYDNFVAAKL